LGRAEIEGGFQNLDRGDYMPGFWYDWVFAPILLREATALIEGLPRRMRRDLRNAARANG
jgi:hypothetical protein